MAEKIDFVDFKLAVTERFAKMSGHQLFVTDVDPDQLWSLYLSSFAEGTDPIFRERAGHDCTCCRQFIRNFGSVVALTPDLQVMSLWDVEIGAPYTVVAQALSQFVKAATLRDVFLTDSKKMGTDRSTDNKNPEIKWDHFYCEAPAALVKPKDRIPSSLGHLRDNCAVLLRGLSELTADSLETVIDLTKQNSLYRGQEHLSVVQQYFQLKQEFDKLENAEKRQRFAWLKSLSCSHLSRLRNTAIGTLLVDLSTNMELDQAVSRYEAMVAPTNYKRPTALVTKSMIARAQQDVKDLGIEDSLERRHANLSDITINNLLFADRSTKIELDAFDSLMAQAQAKPVRDLSKVEDVSIDQFIQDVLPKTTRLELQLANRHQANLMSLIAPVHAGAKNILKWTNNFSWVYNGAVTDSIKERVKRAGGNVQGDFRASLAWFNLDDLDLHLIEPNGSHIHYLHKYNPQTGGTLDVDMNVRPDTRNAVENITYPDKRKMQEGIYHLYVHNFTPRETEDVGFNVELEFNGEIHTFVYNKRVKDNVTVAKFEYSHAQGLRFIESLPRGEQATSVWGIQTLQFVPVKAVMLSPNHWDDNTVGNKHWFFILQDCQNPDETRGLFNEYLMQDLHVHRKVFETLGNRLKVKPSTQQLSGVGFSQTKRDSVLCRVSGSFNRVINLTF